MKDTKDEHADPTGKEWDSGLDEGGLASDDEDILVQDVQDARREMATLNRITPFSSWYKGEHGKARTQLLRSLRTLMKSLKSSKEPASQALFQAAREFSDGVAMKSSQGGRDLTVAIEAWRSVGAPELEEGDKDDADHDGDPRWDNHADPTGKEWHSGLDEATELSNQELRTRASQIWRTARSGRSITAEDKVLMRRAYWVGVLPKDSDYSVAQWVEDGMPVPL